MLASDDVAAVTRRHETRRRTTGAAAALLLALLARCAGMEPYEPRNNREEGPEKGLFTGDEGEFVIFRLRSKPKDEEEPEGGAAESGTQDPD